MRRNVAGQFITCKLILVATGAPCVSGTTTVYVTGDAGTQAIGSVGSGLATHEGNGVWSYAPSQAETNYTQVDFVFVNSTAVNAGPSIYPTSYDANGRYDIGSIKGTAAVGAAGYMGIDWASINAPTTTQTLSGTTIRSGNQIATGTAQAGTSNTITLAAGASATDGLYDPSLVRIISGTGAGQVRLVIDYNGTSKVCVIWRDWRVNPDATSVYELLAATNQQSVNEGLAQAGAASSITLNASASAVNDTYKSQLVWIVGGTGQDQVGIITAYNGTTKVATVAEPWATQPTSSSAYVILPDGRSQLAGTQTFNMTGNVTGNLSGSVGSVTGNVGGSVASVVGAVGSVTGLTASNLDATISSRASAAALASVASDVSAVGVVVSALPSANQNADALLGRNISGGSSGGRTVKQVYHFIRNKWVVAGGTLTVYDTDDTTTSWTGAVTGTPGADPITSLDP